jgi:hypothetical protein
VLLASIQSRRFELNSESYVGVRLRRMWGPASAGPTFNFARTFHFQLSTFYFFRVSFSFSKQMNSISSVFGSNVTPTVVPHGLV